VNLRFEALLSSLDEERLHASWVTREYSPSPRVLYVNSPSAVQ
jgi:hypothetical protein